MSTDPDYLFEDPPISNQKFACISIVTQKSVDANTEANILRTIKIRGCYETEEEARKRAEFLSKSDPNKVSVFVGPVGKWLPFDDDSKYAQDQVYQEKRLNDMMKGYMESQEKAKEFHEQRKNEMILRTLKENEEKQKRNKERQARRDAGEIVDDEVDEKEFLAKQEPEQNINKKVTNKKELTEKENDLKLKEKDVKNNKSDLQQTREEYNKYQKEKEKITKELEDTKRVFEEMLAASNKNKNKVSTAGNMN
jgi:hypothetical protein